MNLITPDTGDILNEPASFDDLPPLKREALALWVKLCLEPSETFVKSRTSYGLKHDMESALRVYISNGQAKGVLLAAGYRHEYVDHSGLNWYFNAKPRCQHRMGFAGGDYRFLCPQALRYGERYASGTGSSRSVGFTFPTPCAASPDELAELDTLIARLGATP